MKALVTGATGFIGSHIADRLVERGHSVRALVRQGSDTAFLEERGVELVRGDITEPETIPPAMDGVDAVFHAAALVTDWAPWPDFDRVTIGGTAFMLESAARAGVSRFLHVSTDGVYAHRLLGRRMTEDSPLETRFTWWDYYRRSKLAAEVLARQYHASGRLAVTVVRPGLVLGERDRVTLPGTIAFLKSATASYLGSGRNRLPCVYAGDVAGGCLLAVDSDVAAGEAYNLVAAEKVTQRDLYRVIGEECNIRLPKRHTPVPLVHALALGFEVASVLRGRRSRPTLSRFAVTMIGRPYIEDPTKADHDFGWRALTSLRESVRRSVAWDREHRRQAVSG